MRQIKGELARGGIVKAVALYTGRTKETRGKRNVPVVTKRNRGKTTATSDIYNIR